MVKLESSEPREIVELFCQFLLDEGHSELTVKNYRLDTATFLRSTQSLKGRKQFDPGSLKASDLQRYREFLISQSYAASTVYRKLASLRVFLRWAAPHLVTEAKRFRYFHAPGSNVKRPLRWLSPHEQEQLFQAVRAGQNPQHIAVISLLLSTGVRVSELCALKVNSVEINRSTAVLKVDQSKEGSPRFVPLNDAAIEAIKNLGFPRHNSKDAPLFTGSGGAVSRRSVDVLVERYANAASLDRITPGILRHTFCRNAALSGILLERLAQIAGHTSLEITKLYYGNAQRSQELELVDDTFDDAPGLNYLGVPSPSIVTVRSGIRRSRSVRAAVLQMAEGRCQMCGAEQKFPGFMQVHHILGTAPEDSIETCMALCPACNVQAHAAPNRDEINRELVAKCAHRKL